MKPLERTEIEKIATDAGFDRPATQSGLGIVVRSSHFAEPVELSLSSDGTIVALIADVYRSRDVCDIPGVLPALDMSQQSDATKGIVVQSREALSNLLKVIAEEAAGRRDSPLAIFRARTRGLPSSTEIERLTIQRIGQDAFRAALIEYWNAECAVTGCQLVELLRASHIKPWSSCATDEERLDRMNGFLLSPAWDAAFDAGFITFADDGEVVISARLTSADRAALGIVDGSRLRRKLQGQQNYLLYHRAIVFKGTA